MEHSRLDQMGTQLAEFRSFAARCRKLAEESPVQEIRDRNLKLARMLEQSVAEIEDGDALLSALQKVVGSLPRQFTSDDEHHRLEQLLTEQH